MTVACEEDCLAIKQFCLNHPDIPPELFHLDCLLDEHLDGYVEGKRFGELADISFTPDGS